MSEATRVQGLCVDVEVLVMGMLSNNVYLVSDGGGTFVVDPTEDADAIILALDGRSLDGIVLTHGHWDHTGAAAELRKRTGAPAYAGAPDADYIEHPSSIGTSRLAHACPVDVRLHNGDIVEIGNMQWKVIGTPGHSKGSICLFTVPAFGNNPDGLPVLISGDTLFQGTHGRTDFEGGSAEEMAASMKKLASLPDDVVVLPGHNSLTTIGGERQLFATFGARPQ